MRRGSGVLDHCGVHRRCTLRDERPVRRSDLVVVDRDVTIGDAGEGRRGVEVFDELLPCPLIAVGVVEVVFEPVCLVAPDGSTGGAGRNRAEHIEVELGGTLGELLDAFEAGEVEGGVELAEVVGESVAFGGGGGERDVSCLVMVVEVCQLLAS